MWSPWGHFTSAPRQSLKGVEPAFVLVDQKGERDTDRKNRNTPNPDAMTKTRLSVMHTFPVFLCILAGCLTGQPVKHRKRLKDPKQKPQSCTKDSQCPAGQRLRVFGRVGSKGKCVAPTGNNPCIDPGGRCGCDGRTVHISCAVDSRTEFASASVDSVGPFPKPCTDKSECISGLLRQKRWGLKP
jgi:hypothetical protein